jgi:hypothetical protein
MVELDVIMEAIQQHLEQQQMVEVEVAAPHAAAMAQQVDQVAEAELHHLTFQEEGLPKEVHLVELDTEILVEPQEAEDLTKVVAEEALEALDKVEHQTVAVAIMVMAE